MKDLTLFATLCANWRTLAKTLLLGLLLAGAGHWATLPLQGAIRSWTGDGSGNLWSDPGNWSPEGIPQDGEDLVFRYTALVFDPDPMFNDLTNLTVRSLTFSVLADITLEWELSGYTLGITHHLELGASDTERVHLNCGFRLGGNTAFVVSYYSDESELYVNGPIDLNGHTLALSAGGTSGLFGECLLEVSGAISGNGNININPPDGGGNTGTVKLDGTLGNTFQGTLTIRRPSHLVLNKESGLAVTGALAIGPYCRLELGRPHQIDDNAFVSLLGVGSQFLLNGHTETIGNLLLTNSVTDVEAALVDTGGATLSVLGGITSANDSASVHPTIRGLLGLPLGNHTVDVEGSSFYGLEIQARIFGAGGFTKIGNSALLLPGSNSFTGNVSVNAGLLDVRNNHALGTTAGSTTLSGNGTMTLRDATIAGETLFVAAPSRSR